MQQTITKDVKESIFISTLVREPKANKCNSMEDTVILYGILTFQYPTSYHLREITHL